MKSGQAVRGINSPCAVPFPRLDHLRRPRRGITSRQASSSSRGHHRLGTGRNRPRSATHRHAMQSHLLPRAEWHDPTPTSPDGPERRRCRGSPPRQMAERIGASWLSARGLALAGPTPPRGLVELAVELADRMRQTRRRSTAKLRLARNPRRNKAYCPLAQALTLPHQFPRQTIRRCSSQGSKGEPNRSSTRWPQVRCALVRR